MPLTLGRVLLCEVTVQPDQQIPIWFNNCVDGKGPTTRKVQIISQGVACQIDGLATGIVEFQPVFEPAVGWVGEG